jgi:hypothetical protein
MATAVVRYIIIAQQCCTKPVLYIGGSFSAHPPIITWMVSTLGRTPEKGTAIVNAMDYIGNLV